MAIWSVAVSQKRLLMSFCIGMNKVNCFYGIMEFHQVGKIERLVLIYFQNAVFQ